MWPTVEFLGRFFFNPHLCRTFSLCIYMTVIICMCRKNCVHSSSHWTWHFTLEPLEVVLFRCNRVIIKLIKCVDSWQVIETDGQTLYFNIPLFLSIKVWFGWFGLVSQILWRYYESAFCYILWKKKFIPGIVICEWTGLNIIGRESVFLLTVQSASLSQCHATKTRCKSGCSYTLCQV